MFAERRPWVQLIDEPEWVVGETQWLKEYVTGWSIGNICYELIIYCGLIHADNIRKVVVCNLTETELTDQDLGYPVSVARATLHEVELSGGVELALGAKNSVYMSGLNLIFENIFANDKGLPDELIAYLAELRLLYKGYGSTRKSAAFYFAYLSTRFVSIYQFGKS